MNKELCSNCKQPKDDYYVTLLIDNAFCDQCDYCGEVEQLGEKRQVAIINEQIKKLKNKNGISDGLYTFGYLHFDRTILLQKERSIMTDEEIYEKALEKWGHGLQLIKTIEELAELQQEISKVLLDCEMGEWAKVDALAEELADVEIMLSQVKKMIINDVTIGKKVDVYKKQKMERLVEMVGDSND